MAAVKPRRKSLSTFILQIFISVARRSCCVAMPRAFDMWPPNLFIVVIRCVGMLDAPCRTSGKFGMRLAMSDNISNLSSSSSDLRLWAPWLVPIDMAKESMPVCVTNFSASEGLVYVEYSDDVFSSSMPDKVPSSASTLTLCLWASSTTVLEILTFSLNGSLLASIMTDEKPISMACRHVSMQVPWSRCSAICSSG